MSGLKVDLGKLSEGIIVDLEKRVIDSNKLPDDINVTLALDVSGSMQHLFQDGKVLHTLQRVVAVSNVIDDDGILNFNCFSSSSFPQEDIEAKRDFKNLPQLVKDLSRTRGGFWGGTYFQPVLSDIVNGHKDATTPAPTTKVVNKSVPVTSFIGKMWNIIRGVFGLAPNMTTVQETVIVPPVLKSEEEVTKQLVILITDGDNNDETSTRAFFKEMQKDNQFFFQCIGVGHSSRFLRECASQFSNVGYTELSSFTEDDDALTSALVSTQVLRHFGY